MPASHFNPAPGWPAPPEGWEPPADWTPPADWPEAPEGWNFWLPAEPATKSTTGTIINSVRTARGQSRIDENAVANPLGTAANEVLWEGASSQLTGIGGGRFRLTRHHLYFESGVLRTDSQQIPVEHIYDVDVSQTMMQKGRGVYNVQVHLHRPNGVSEVIVMENLTDGKGVQGVINEAVRARNLELAREKTTHTYLGGNQPPHLPQVVAPASQQAEEKKPDIIEQIGRLGELLKLGVLTQDEFDAKKSDLLSRL
jgi:hypothetical protein